MGRRKRTRLSRRPEAIAQSPRSNAGGSAMQSGARYQNRAPAWLAVQMLAENDLPWDLPASTSAESINCETTNSADDIFATTSSGGRIYVQAKARLLWNADFVSALTQCVRQSRDLCGAGRSEEHTS